MKLKPLADKVVLKQIEAEEKTKGGIILTSAGQEKPEIYEVIAVGPGGVIVANPPYGERLADKHAAEQLYAAFGAAYRKLENWKLYLLSSHTEFERCFGRAADRKRKLYNGMLKCDLFMYL